VQHQLPAADIVLLAAKAAAEAGAPALRAELEQLFRRIGHAYANPGPGR
jgi:RNase P protein component